MRFLVRKTGTIRVRAPSATHASPKLARRKSGLKKDLCILFKTLNEYCCRESLSINLQRVKRGVACSLIYIV